MRISGIYQIKSKIKPERIYIGSAINISERWRLHLVHLRRNKHHSIKLQNHFNKYGEADLQFSILLGCPKEELIKTEQYFIDSYKPWFNISPTAGSSLGIKRSIEYIQRVTGIKRSEEVRQNISEAHKGIKQSVETRKKRSEKLKGRIITKEARFKISISNTGKKRTAESRRKMSDKKHGIKRCNISEEEIIRMENLLNKIVKKK